jgi:NAD(P)-dependent dehydrogenase (short-subunit alcohol dehydrogenase family)
VSLAGRVAVVTGGGSGIGRGIALRLARDGADVALFDVDLAAAETVAGEIRAAGRRALPLRVDVASMQEVTVASAQVHETLGRVQVLVNNAGIASFVPLLQMGEEEWDRMIAVHLKGTFNCTRVLLQDMVDGGWGRVVCISSVGGLRGGPSLTHYAAAKAGMIGFTKALAIEMGPLGVTVNAIAPGMIDTPLLARSGVPQAILDIARNQAPVRRLGTPDDIAAACAYLVSEEASFTTGQVLSPNGGGHL